MAVSARCPCPAGCELFSAIASVSSWVDPLPLQRGATVDVTEPSVVCRGAVRERDVETGAFLDLHVRGGVLLPVSGAVRFDAVVPSAISRIRLPDVQLRAELLDRQARARRRRLVQASMPSVEARVVRVLADLSVRVGITDAEGTLIPLALTRRTIAELVGCREESLVRLVGRWEAEGVLEWGREGIRLRAPWLSLTAAR